MKTTIDLDEAKLLNVMKLKGFKTRKQAIDYALDEAERRARIESVASSRWTARECRELFADDYDVRSLRGRTGKSS